MNGATTKLTAKAFSSMLTETSTKEIGSIIRLTVSEFTKIRMVPAMKEIGKMTSNKVKELRSGLMAPSSKVTIQMESNKELGSIRGRMGQLMMVKSKLTQSMGSAFISGQMVVNILDSGPRMTWPALVTTCGHTE